MRAGNAGSFKPRAQFPGPDDGAMRIPPFTPLADGFVRYCGEPILGIVAIDKASAELALEAVNILFETSVAVIDVANALSNGAACVWDNYPDNRCFHFEKGDSNKVKKENANAAHVRG